jgi:hypothetical protein
LEHDPSPFGRLAALIVLRRRAGAALEQAWQASHDKR